MLLHFICTINITHLIWSLVLPVPLSFLFDLFGLWFVSQDDILPKLMATAGSHEDLFRKEISKYDNICEEIAKNLGAQEQLLMHIQV